MTSLPPDVKTIFGKAIAIESAEQRGDFLNRECGQNALLREQIVQLLRAFEDAGSFMDRPSAEVDATIASNAGTPEGPGSIIGPYKLLQKLGEGGMGVVYLADQQQPVKRRVAVKIIKQGMDTRQVIARFEAERQALAMMDHPNIARVLDAGCSDTGRPYFVMELVKGGST